MTYTAAMLRYQIRFAASAKKLNALADMVAANRSTDAAALYAEIETKRRRIEQGCGNNAPCKNHPNV